MNDEMRFKNSLFWAYHPTKDGGYVDLDEFSLYMRDEEALLERIERNGLHKEEDECNR